MCSDVRAVAFEWGRFGSEEEFYIVVKFLQYTEILSLSLANTNCRMRIVSAEGCEPAYKLRGAVLRVYTQKLVPQPRCYDEYRRCDGPECSLRAHAYVLEHDPERNRRDAKYNGYPACSPQTSVNKFLREHSESYKYVVCSSVCGTALKQRMRAAQIPDFGVILTEQQREEQPELQERLEHLRATASGAARARQQQAEQQGDWTDRLL